MGGGATGTWTININGTASGLCTTSSVLFLNDANDSTNGIGLLLYPSQNCDAGCYFLYFNDYGTTTDVPSMAVFARDAQHSATILHSKNYGTYALPITGGIITGGSLVINKDVTADTFASTPSYIELRATRTDLGISTRGFIRVYDDGDDVNYNATMVISSTGHMIIGSGESPTNCYSTDIAANIGEEMYVTSDNSIHFYSNCNTYANKKEMVFNTSGVLVAPTFQGALSGNASTATALTTSAGSATQPVYFSGGKPVACTYTLAKSVPSNAVFTDTKDWASITGKPSTFTPASHTHSYLPLTGGTLTGALSLSYSTNATMDETTTNPRIIFSENGKQPVILAYTDYDSYRSPHGLKVIGGDGAASWFEVQGNIYGSAIYGAVWNDYAEYRSSCGEIPAGFVIKESKDGLMRLTEKRLEPACKIVSDTFGFSIGKNYECQTPIAVSGRVLAYPAENRYSYELGDAVCSAPGGKISKMTREEIMMYPERIIGTVSEIPEYERWGTGDVLVDGRIWIYVK